MTRRARRIAFGLYATALFVGTHYPNLRIRVPHVERPDLIVHMVVFGVWYGLLLAAEFAGPWRRMRSIATCTLVAAGFACLDEYSQSLPGLGRTAALDDLTANLAGIGLATVIAAILAATRRKKIVGRDRSTSLQRQADESGLG